LAIELQTRDVQETFQAETETKPKTHRSETEMRRSGSEMRPRLRCSLSSLSHLGP